MTLKLGRIEYEIQFRRGALILNGNLRPAILDHDDRRIILADNLSREQMAQALCRAFEDIASGLNPIPLIDVT